MQFIHSFKIHFQLSFIYKASKLSKALYLVRNPNKHYVTAGRKIFSQQEEASNRTSLREGEPSAVNGWGWKKREKGEHR